MNSWKTHLKADPLPWLLEPDPDNPGRMLTAIPDDEKRGQLVSRLYDRLLDKREGEKAMAESRVRETLGRLAQRHVTTSPQMDEAWVSSVRRLRPGVHKVNIAQGPINARPIPVSRG